MPVMTGPSGLKLEWREMEMDDEDRLAANADKPEASQMEALDELLGHLVGKVLDKKHYRFDTLDVNGLLTGDRTKYLVDVRNDAFGHEIEVVEKCPAGHDINQVVDLRHLPLEPLPEASAAALAAGKPLAFTLPRCKRIVQWQMLTGHLETAMLEVVTDNPKSIVSEAAAIRIVSVEGFDDAGLDPETQQDLRGWLKKLHTRDSRALRQHIANNECGVKTTVTIPCGRSGCRGKIEVDMLTHSDFFPLIVEREESTVSSDS